MRRARNECSIGDWRKDCFTGVWPGPRFTGDKFVRLPIGNTGYKRYTDTSAFSYRAVRWDHVKVSMLELQDKAEISSMTEVWL